MDIAALHAFVTVAETRSFSEAALRLHLTQPAISKRIAQLETSLNCQLFDRIGRQIHLTEAGQAQVVALTDLEERIAEAQEAGRKSILLLVRRAGDPRFVALSIADDN